MPWGTKGAILLAVTALVFDVFLQLLVFSLLLVLLLICSARLR